MSRKGWTQVLQLKKEKENYAYQTSHSFFQFNLLQQIIYLLFLFNFNFLYLNSSTIYILRTHINVSCHRQQQKTCSAKTCKV